jgi:hypothetical protein
MENMELDTNDMDLALDGLLDLSVAGICGKVAGALVAGTVVKGYEEFYGSGAQLKETKKDLAEANAAAKQAQTAAVVGVATAVVAFSAWGLNKLWGKFQAEKAAEALVAEEVVEEA